MELLSALQALLWNRAEHIGLRLAPRWPSGGLSAAFLMGSLAGAAGGWLRRKK